MSRNYEMRLMFGYREQGRPAVRERRSPSDLPGQYPTELGILALHTHCHPSAIHLCAVP